MQPEPSHAAPDRLAPAGRRRVLAVLCGTEITSWGVLYYAFPVLAPGISAEQREELEASIKKLEQHYFAQDGNGQVDLRQLAEGWVSRAT